MNTSDSHYIYTLSDPNTHEVRYVGQTIDLRRRYLKHVSESIKGDSHVKCWIKGLVKNSTYPIIETLDQCSSDEVNIYEKMYIGLFKQWGFDLTNISEGGRGMKFVSLDTRHKISASLMGKKPTEETIKKRSETSKKTWSNPELRELKRKQTKHLIDTGVINNKERTSKKRGIPLSEEVKKKTSEGLKKFYANNPAARIKNAISKGAKRFNVFTCSFIKRGNRWGRGYVTKGDHITSFLTISDASKMLNIERTHIRRCLHGELLQTRGYIFEYANI